MGDATASKKSQSKRRSAQVHRGEDESSFLEIPKLDDCASSDGAAHSDQIPDAQTSSKPSQTVESDLPESWYGHDGTALKSEANGADFADLEAYRASFDGSDFERHIFYPAGADHEGLKTSRRPDSNDGAPQMPAHELSYEPMQIADFLNARPEAADRATQLPYNAHEDVLYRSTAAQYSNGDDVTLQQAVAPDPYEHLQPSIGIQSTEQEDWIHVAGISAPETTPREVKIPDPYAPEPGHEQLSSSRASGIISDALPPVVEHAYIEHSETIPPPPPPPPLEIEHTRALLSEPPPAITEGTTFEPGLHTNDIPPQDVYPADRTTRHQDTLSGDGFAKLLRRLRRNIDEVLNKRTQWQNEQQKLERLRKFYTKSIKGMIAVIEAEHPPGEDPEGQKDETKDKESAPEQTANFDIAASQTIDRPISSGSGRDSGAATTSSSRGPADTATSISFESFKEAKRQVREDENALTEQEDVLKSLVEQINNLEYHVQELVQEITKQMSSPTFIDELRLDMLNVEATTQDSEPRPEPEDDTPELVSKYFDWMGERGINLERLQELDHNHNEGLVQRDFLRDQGRDLDVSDEEYLVNYHSHREDIVLRLNEANENIKHYFRLCEEARLDPESYRRVAPSVYSADMSHASRPQIQQFAQTEEGRVASKRSMSPPYEGSKLRHIEGWLRDVAPGQSDFVAGIAPPTELQANTPP